MKWMLSVSTHKINDGGYSRSSSIEIADGAKQIFMHFSLLQEEFYFVGRDV